MDYIVHRCVDKCFDSEGTRICGNRNDFVAPKVPKKEPYVATNVVTTACLNLMGAIMSENKSLLGHQKDLEKNLEDAADARKDMLEYEQAAQGEMEIITSLSRKIEDYKEQLVKELSPVPQECFHIEDQVGRTA